MWLKKLEKIKQEKIDKSKKERIIIMKVTNKYKNYLAEK